MGKECASCAKLKAEKEALRETGKEMLELLERAKEEAESLKAEALSYFDLSNRLAVENKRLRDTLQELLNKLDSPFESDIVEKAYKILRENKENFLDN